MNHPKKGAISRGLAPLCVLGLLSVGILAGCGTANRYNVNDYNGRLNNYNHDGLNNLNNRYSPYYNNRTNIYGTDTNRTNIYGTNGTNIYDAYYPQNAFDSDYLRDRNMMYWPNTHTGR